MKKQLVVIGGGAAGFFCAVNAARLDGNLKVVLLEKTGKLLSKVKVSGGGRCNVTHSIFDIAEMSKRYPRGAHFVKKTFHQFFTTDTIRWFEQRGVSLKTEVDGRMFPVTDDSQTIIDCLMREVNHLGIEVQLHSEVKSLHIQNGQFNLQLAGGRNQQANYVCIACGGYSKLSMFDWLKQLGHSIAEPVPSLFTFNLPKHPITSLMGVSVNSSRIKIEGTRLTEEGPLLITHWGFSGPAILKLSAWGARELFSKHYHFRVHVNWMPFQNEMILKKNFQQLRISTPAKMVSNHNFSQLPNRLWTFLLEQSGISGETRFGDLPAKSENSLIRNLTDYVVEVQGKTTYKEEFVTAGGVSLNEVDANTMMSRKVPDLFFAGEILDVDGITGGFNFQHAWTSGWIAAKSIAEKYKV